MRPHDTSRYPRHRCPPCREAASAARLLCRRTPARRVRGSYTAVRPGRWPALLCCMNRPSNRRDQSRREAFALFLWRSRAGRRWDGFRRNAPGGKCSLRRGRGSHTPCTDRRTGNLNKNRRDRGWPRKRYMGSNRILCPPRWIHCRLEYSLSWQRNTPTDGSSNRRSRALPFPARRRRQSVCFQ